MVVAGADRIINPRLERFYAARAGSKTIEVAGASHSVFISHPEEIADVIEDAARAASNVSLNTLYSYYGRLNAPEQSSYNSTVGSNPSYWNAPANLGAKIQLAQSLQGT
jgi:hypothetical protein